MPKNAKYGGRKIGTPNKVSQELKEVLSEYSLSEFQFLIENIESLSLANRVLLFTKILPYVLPKQLEVEAHQKETSVPIILFSNGSKLE